MPSTPTDPISPTSWSYAETFVGEDDVMAAARARATEVGVVAVGSGAGATLRFLASALEARSVVAAVSADTASAPTAVMDFLHHPSSRYMSSISFRSSATAIVPLGVGSVQVDATHSVVPGAYH